MAALTPRGKTLRFLKEHRGITEHPSGSNTDDRPNAHDGRWGIRKAQLACAGGATWLVGTAWCGEWARWALQHAGVQGLSSRQASVALIEDDARAGRGPFLDWKQPWEWRAVLRGDLAVMFGRGVHVEVVRSFKTVAGSVIVVTEGGNTSSGTAGSQSNGGGAFRRERRLSDVHGFARVNYRGGKTLLRVDAIATRLLPADGVRAIPDVVPAAASSDLRLQAALNGHAAEDAGVRELLDAMVTTDPR